jgi:GH43 family beta-xylosidase
VRFNKGNEIWGGKLNEDMISVNQESLRLMIKPDQGWEQQKGQVVEGAEVIKHKGTYYLTYSGSHFESPDYAVGYATSRSPLGPWKKFEFNPIMKSTSYAHGSAHHCLTSSPDGTEHFIVYHRHNTLSKTEPRQMSIDRIQFVPQESGPDVLEVWGPTSSPQPLPSGAENAGAK